MQYDPRAEENYIASMNASQIGRISSAGLAPETAVDGLTSCLRRIQGISNHLAVITERMANLGDRIGGPTLSGGNEKSQLPQNPDNALFLARQIESVLNEIAISQVKQLDRIENAIG